MTARETTELAVVQSEVKYINESVTRIEQTLGLFIDKYETNHKELEAKFAPMDIKRQFIQHNQDFRVLEHEMSELPIKLKDFFAPKWIGKVVVGGISLGVTGLIAFLINHFAL